MSTPQQLLPTIILVAALLVLLAVLLFLWSLRQFRLSRTDSYWRRRRTAGQRGLRALVWSITLTFLGGALWVAIVLSYFAYFRPSASTGGTKIAVVSSITPTPQISTTEAPTKAASSVPTTIIPSATMTASSTATISPATSVPTQTPTPSPSVTVFATSSTAQTSSTPSRTPQSTASPTSVSSTLTMTATPLPAPSMTPTVSETPSSTPTATTTASPTLRPVNIASLTLVSSVTPSPNATLKITALDTQISSNFEPVAPAEIFTPGFARMYFFVTFSGMQPGILWRRELVKDDTVIQTHTYLWGLQEEGAAYFFFGEEDGFKPGKYQIRLYLGKLSEPIAEKTFIVKE